MFNKTLILASFLFVSTCSFAVSFDINRAKTSQGVCVDTKDLGRILMIPDAKGWSISMNWKTSSPCLQTRKAVTSTEMVMICESSVSTGDDIKFQNADGNECRIIYADEPTSRYSGSLTLKNESLSLIATFIDANGSVQSSNVDSIKYLDQH